MIMKLMAKQMTKHCIIHIIMMFIETGTRSHGKNGQGLLVHIPMREKQKFDKHIEVMTQWMILQTTVEIGTIVDTIENQMRTHKETGTQEDTTDLNQEMTAKK